MAKIMVVDDAADIRFLMGAVLSRAGFTVVEVHGGAQAIAECDRGQLPDAVVLDVQMPDLDGWQTLAMLRSHGAARDVPVVLCTVKSQPDDARRAWELGCDGYLTKPFAIAELVEEVTAVLARTCTERHAIRRARLSTAREQPVTIEGRRRA